MELATALIWTLRIVLPIILFCIYFKFQSGKDDAASFTTTSSKGKISRSKLLSHRKVAAADKTVPEALSTLTLKDQTQAPSLFQSTGERGGKGGGRGGGRSNREDRGDRGDRNGREKGERREKREPRDAEQKEKPRAAQEAKRQQVLETIPADPEVATPAAEGAAEMVANQEKMHLESLLNYVAFKSKDQQRNFVIEDDAPPPPPPPPSKSASVAAEEGAALKALDLSGTTVEKANAEAQMVLRGAINFKRVDIAKDLYEQLSSASIEIAEATFTLMIEAAVLAKDLKSSSDFLMKMETSGHSPATDILDKVLDLYSNQKQQREQEKQNNANRQAQSALGNFGYQEVIQEARTKLTSDARIFVPTWGIPPPPPKPPAKADEESEGKKEEAETADAVTEAAQPVPEQRTKLKAAAKPFEPMWNGPQFGEPAPPMPTWDTWNAEDSNNGYGKSKGGKGHGSFQIYDSPSNDLENGGSNDYDKGRGKGNKGKANGSSDATKASTGKKWKPKETAATAA